MVDAKAEGFYHLHTFAEKLAAKSINFEFKKGIYDMSISEDEIIDYSEKLELAEERNPIWNEIASVGVNGFVITALSQLSTHMPEFGSYLMQSFSESAGEVAGEITESIFKAALRRKRNKFMDKVANYEGCLTTETIYKINSVQFILEFAKTLDVIDRLASDEKINYIANLFGKYFIKEHHEDEDFFEESLFHLSSLSFREIEILISLYQIEEEIYAKNKELGRAVDPDVMARGSVSTYRLIEMAPEKWDMDEDELMSILTSLCKSGFVREVVGAYTGYSGGVFYTTSYLKKFLSYILD